MKKRFRLKSFADGYVVRVNVIANALEQKSGKSFDMCKDGE